MDSFVVDSQRGGRADGIGCRRWEAALKSQIPVISVPLPSSLASRAPTSSKCALPIYNSGGVSMRNAVHWFNTALLLWLSRRKPVSRIADPLGRATHAACLRTCCTCVSPAPTLHQVVVEKKKCRRSSSIDSIPVLFVSHSFVATK